MSDETPAAWRPPAGGEQGPAANGASAPWASGEPTEWRSGEPGAPAGADPETAAGVELRSSANGEPEPLAHDLSTSRAQTEPEPSEAAEPRPSAADVPESRAHAEAEPPGQAGPWSAADGVPRPRAQGEPASPAEAVPPAGTRPERPAEAGPGAQHSDEPGSPADGEPGLRAAIEAILLVVDEPVAEVTLAQILERPRDEIVATLRELAAEYTAQGRGFDLREIAGGWRFYTRQECAPLVERFVMDGQQTRLTQAALETLAVVAYRQPVSRARVSAIRGVISDGVIRTLTLRGLIEEAGHDPEHQAILYQTTGYFLERLGLRSLDELPELAPFLPDDVADLEDQEL